MVSEAAVFFRNYFKQTQRVFEKLAALDLLTLTLS